MERSSFFTSLNGDRKYKATDFAKYFGSFIGNGVFPNPSTNLQVTSNGDMTVSLSKGLAWTEGYLYDNTDNLILIIDHSDATLKRIDRVVLRCDFIKREIKAYIKKGTFASDPVAPKLQRNVDAYELSVAKIMIDQGIISIQQSKITDTRLDNSVCGIVTQVVNTIDTATLYNQLQAYIAEHSVEFSEWIKEAKLEFEGNFNSWFDSIKSILDENTAGNLLNLINKNKEGIEKNESSIKDLSTKVDDIELVSERIIYTNNGCHNVKEALDNLYTKVSDINIELAEKVLINLSSEDGSSVIGQIITIDYVDEGISKDYVYDGNSVSIMVKQGDKYHVSVNSRPGYSVPAPQRQVAIMGNIRQINMVYQKVIYYGVKIDETKSSPLGCITYIENAVGFKRANNSNVPPGSMGYGSWKDIYPFNQIKPCGFKDGKVVKYIKPENFTQYVDGSAVPADVDVMIEFPKVYWKFTQVDNGYEIRICEKRGDEHFICPAHMVGGKEIDKIYIGAYLGYASAGKLVSVTGKKPTTDIALSGFRNLAYAKGNGYKVMNYYCLLMLQVLYTVLYADLDSQNALGLGFVQNPNYASTNTGGANTRGMLYGTGYGTDQMKFLGLEDFWGNVSHILDGVLANSAGEVLICDDNINFNDGGAGYQKKFNVSAMSGGWVNKVMADNIAGFIIKERSGSSSTYYCDAGSISLPSNSVFCGGSWGDGVQAGAYALGFSTGQQSTGWGTRLVYMNEE